MDCLELEMTVRLDDPTLDMILEEFDEETCLATVRCGTREIHFLVKRTVSTA